VIVLAAVNYHGITRTAGLTRILVVGVVIALAIAVAACGGGSGANPATLLGDGLLAHGWYGILQSAGLLFFAFAGYARIATMGEEVRDPKRTIPRAIGIALAITVVVYAVIAVTSWLPWGQMGWQGVPHPWPRLSALVLGPGLPRLSGSARPSQH
jgi:APA family basic amino acid/polyamine antiporter